MSTLASPLATVKFFVPGVAKPGGSKRVFPLFQGQGESKKWLYNRVSDASGTAGKDWRASVQVFARNVYGERPLMVGALKVIFTFYVQRPKGHFNKRGLKPSAPLYPVKKPDVLKLSRAVEDALTGIVWRDDAQIVTETILKRYDEKPGVQVEISEELQ